MATIIATTKYDLDIPTKVSLDMTPPMVPIVNKEGHFIKSVPDLWSNLRPEDCLILITYNEKRRVIIERSEV